MAFNRGCVLIKRRWFHQVSVCLQTNGQASLRCRSHKAVESAERQSIWASSDPVPVGTFLQSQIYLKFQSTVLDCELGQWMYRCFSQSAVPVTRVLAAYQWDSCISSGCAEAWYRSPGSLVSLYFIRCCYFFFFKKYLSNLCVLLMCGRGVSLISLKIFLCQTAKSIPQSMLICFSRTWRLNLNFFPMLWKINLFLRLKNGCQIFKMIIKKYLFSPYY